MHEVILAGRPNSGKSTLFNRIAAANQKVGNYAGCTVEKKTAVVEWEEGDPFEVTDLPGLYSLRPNSLDEEVALRHLEEKQASSYVVFVLDGNNLEQELVLPLMLKRQGYKIGIAVNMMDEVRANRRILDLAGMKDIAGIPFFPVSAKTGEGVDTLKKFLARSAFPAQAAEQGETCETNCGCGKAADLSGEQITELNKAARQEARQLNSLNRGEKENFLLNRDKKFDRLLLHPVIGPVVFLFVMFLLFQSIFTWAAPLSDGIDGGIGLLQDLVKAHLPTGFIASLLGDGILAGLGAVLVFVPQIAILFLLIGLLEYSGYLPRVAAMVDRLLKPYGLNGKVFIPLLSSVACAVPGIMATRTIESERTRLLTIMVSPLMTCSARLPVYTLLIATFVPGVALGPFSLQGLVMFSMYLLGVIMALAVAFILHKLDFQQRKHVLDFIHLPHYRMPNWPELFRYVWRRVAMFLKKAGTIIAGMAVLLWFLLSFPADSIHRAEISQAKTAVAANANLSQADRDAQLAELDSKQASYDLEASLGGRAGHLLEPVFRPIGYDWRLTIGILGSMAAREVFVSTLGTVFALGNADEHTDSLGNLLRAQKNPDGSPQYTLATCLSLLVFFAFSLQCISTIGIARRETNSWKIPAVMFVYMFVIAYIGAFIVFHAANLFLA